MWGEARREVFGVFFMQTPRGCYTLAMTDPSRSPPTAHQSEGIRLRERLFASMELGNIIDLRGVLDDAFDRWGLLPDANAWLPALLKNSAKEQRWSEIAAVLSRLEDRNPGGSAFYRTELWRACLRADRAFVCAAADGLVVPCPSLPQTLLMWWLALPEHPELAVTWAPRMAGWVRERWLKEAVQPASVHRQVARFRWLWEGGSYQEDEWHDQAVTAVAAVVSSRRTPMLFRALPQGCVPLYAVVISSLAAVPVGEEKREVGLAALGAALMREPVPIRAAVAYEAMIHAHAVHRDEPWRDPLCRSVLGDLPIAAVFDHLLARLGCAVATAPDDLRWLDRLGQKMAPDRRNAAVTAVRAHRDAASLERHIGWLVGDHRCRQASLDLENALPTPTAVPTKPRM